MAFESGVVPEDWMSPLTVKLYKGKIERNKCKNYRCICFLIVVAKIYAGVLIVKVCRNDDLINNEQGGFRSWRECVDQIFDLRRIGEKK